MHIKPGLLRRAATLVGADIAIWAFAASIWWFVFDDSANTSADVFNLFNLLTFKGATLTNVLMSFLVGVIVLLLVGMLVDGMIDAVHWLLTGETRGAKKTTPDAPKPVYTHCNDPRCGCGYHQKPIFHEGLREWINVCRFDDCTCGHHRGQVFDHDHGWWVMGEDDLRFAGKIVYPSIGSIHN